MYAIRSYYDSAINKQRAYGADVISRIQASNDGKSEELKKTIREELQAGLKTLIKKDSKIQHIFLAGNTTMVHLFMGYSCNVITSYSIHYTKLYDFDIFNNTVKIVFYFGCFTAP